MENNNSESYILDRIEELKNQIDHHSRLYYVEDESTISDAEFDALMKELIDLEEEAAKNLKAALEKLKEVK